MSLLRDLGFSHLLFFVGICLLLVGLLVRWRATDEDPSLLVTVGWLSLGAYWLSTAYSRLVTAYFFLGLTSFAIATVCLYASSLTYRRRSPGMRVTKAFVVMGLIYVPFEYVEPVYRFGLETVASHTAVGTALVGVDPAIKEGGHGYLNLLVLPGPIDGELVALSIISACTGISAIALFVGLISLSTASRRRKLAAIAVVVPAIYLLNVVRNVFTAVAYSTHTFSFVVEPVSGVYRASDGPYFSYLVAEQVVTPIYIVVGTVVVYSVLVRWLPDIEDALSELVAVTERDYRRLARRYADRFA